MEQETTKKTSQFAENDIQTILKETQQWHKFEKQRKMLNQVFEALKIEKQFEKRLEKQRKMLNQVFEALKKVADRSDSPKVKVR